MGHPATFPSSSPLLGLDGLLTLQNQLKATRTACNTAGKDGTVEKDWKEERGGKDGKGGAEENGGEDREDIDTVTQRTVTQRTSLTVTVTKEDAALSTASSFDPETGHHASDHRPVCGTVVWR